MKPPFQFNWPLVVTVLVTCLVGACDRGPEVDLGIEAVPAVEVADRIFHGGTIVTLDEDNPVVEAVAVKHGRILATGTFDEIMKYGSATDIVDLGTTTMVPGFIDGHSHFYMFGVQAVGANLLAPPDGGVNNIDDLVAALKKWSRSDDVDKTGWIFGLGYDDAVLEENRHPTRDDLDKVSTDVPVIAVHISGHFAAVNGKGLALIGYTVETEDPEGGIIRRRPDSDEPNGVLEELAAIPVLTKIFGSMSAEDKQYFLDKGQDMAMSFGYTTAQEGRATPAIHAALVNAAEDERLKIDVVSYIDYAAQEPLHTPWNSREYQNRYRVGGMKITLDGSPQGRTAWRTFPYLLPPDGQEEGYSGYPVIPDDHFLTGLYDTAYANNWQVLTHANGDAAIDQMIRTLRPAMEKYGRFDRRPVLIHGQFLRAGQIRNLKHLGVILSLFPMHTFYWGDWYTEIIGPEMAERIAPTQSVLDEGMIFTSHTDAPVALPNLINVMWSTVNRVSRTGQVIGPDERVAPLDALKAVTLWGAYQHFEEDAKGSIEIGKLADFVILSANPLVIDPMLIKDIKVLETIKEGKTVYAAE